jgi:hypothetical protein
MTTKLIEAFRQTIDMLDLLLSLIMVYCIHKLLMIKKTKINNKGNIYTQ